VIFNEEMVGGRERLTHATSNVTALKDETVFRIAGNSDHISTLDWLHNRCIYRLQY